jgi:hypothetical protein
MSDIPNTILAQLGGNKFVAMTGARVLIGHNAEPAAQRLGGLSFKIGSGAKDGITHVRVFLMSSDTYTVEFLKIRGVSCKTVSEHSMVYADQLRKLFTEATGFETSL